MKRLIVLLCMILASWSSAPKAQLAKQVYFAPYDTVTINGEQRFRARCFGMSGAHVIDLRPDGGATGVGHALCISDALPANMTGVLSITNALDGTVSPVVKGLIRAAIGTANVNELTATTFDQLIFQLLIDLPKAKPGLWKPVRPGKDGKYHIHLGQEFQQTAWIYPYVMDNGLIADAQNIMLAAIEPAIAWAASFTDNFNCSDSASLTCVLTWTEWSGTACEILSNQAHCSGTGGQTATRAEADTATDNQIVSMILVSLEKGNGTDAAFDIIARKDSSTTGTYYACEANDDSVADTHVLYKRVSGTRTDLATSTTNVTANETLTIQADNSSISCIGTIAQGPVTDSSITGNTRAGFRYNGSGTTSDVVADDFSLQDVAVSILFGPLRRGTF